MSERADEKVTRTLDIEPRLDEDGRQMFGEPEFREALGHIGHVLGLHGSFHLVYDVVRAVEDLAATDAGKTARLLAAARRAQDHAADARRHADFAASDLKRALRLLRSSEAQGDEVI